MNEYWRKRELKHMKETIKDDVSIAKRIEENRKQAMDDIQEQIDAFYGRYAKTEGITMEEARKRVANADVEKYQRKAKRYVQQRNFTERANEEMRLYNVTMRVNRLELLQANIHLELIAAYSGDERLLMEEMTKRAISEYERQSGILGQTVRYGETGVRNIVTASFHNATWSDRLWSDQDALRGELRVLLRRGINQGINPRVLAREMRKKIDSSVSDSERLLITEMARIQTDVQKDSFEKLDFDSYEYIAEPTACKVCEPLDGKIFKVKDMEIGKNAAPMHPYCKCSTAAAMDREEWDRKLKERGL
ncbi:minor capsid protein [Halalkalibacterium halodurans]|uniref:minor capsid protein n=1 Tax=Halalkalibacterium halodurans TaxID=86665 RepID=UPI002E1C0904|nr:minor capsid protein [Halalkalibacterium halodurans]MED4083877.1 minor capsid protein [Halalkalibacterium halodurans]MED4105514.1 minor capsid protein [Halalkalibacterium halodurans]MED4109280.1 minor capsid protein [Halalkalibacterium halodurans]MED4149706.1 minor capsid protein [Halalkalibacterium halodurans]